jgi:hypothetical protein
MTRYRGKKIGRRHHSVCLAIKHADLKPACADFTGQDCDLCLASVDNDEVITFERMEPVQQPECKEHSAMVICCLKHELYFINMSLQSAFDLATSYPDLSKKLFPNGPCHPLVGFIHLI